MTVIRTPHVIAVCLGFLGGIASASFAYAASYVPSWIFSATFVALLTIATWRFNHRHRAIVCCGIVAFGLGIIRFTTLVSVPSVTLTAPDNNVVLEGRVRSVTQLARGRQRLRIINARIMSSQRDDAPEAHFRREIAVFVPVANSEAAAYGDTVRVRCRFTAPKRLGDRLTTDGDCVAWAAGDLRVVATGGGSPTLRALAVFRRDLAGRLDRALADPARGIVASMVLGVPHAVGPGLETAFRRSGTIHILVVSGWHMSYIADRLRRAFLAVGIPRGIALRFAPVCIAAFTLLVGLTAPAVRGALVAIALACVGLIGRIANPLRVLLLVATAMVAAHPYILGFDLAFQLTVSATAAIILAAPIAARLFPCRPGVICELRDLTAASIAASFATAPLLASAFGAVAIFGPLVGIVVLPLAAAIIPVGAFFFLASALIPLITSPVAWALTALAAAIARLVETTAALSWAQLPTARLDGWFIAAIYILMFVAILRWYRHRGIAILSPFAFTATPQGASGVQSGHLSSSHGIDAPRDRLIR